MADNSDDDDDEQQPVAHRQESLRTVLGNLLGAEEFEDVDDDEDAGVDDVLADLIGNTDLSNDPGDVNDESDDAGGSGGTATPAAAQSTQTALALGGMRRQLWLESMRRTFGFAAAVRLDTVDITYSPASHAWLTDPVRSEALISESGRVHAAIRAAIDPTSSDVPPPMGCANTHAVPSSLADVQLPRWAAVAPKLSASNTVTTMHTNVEPDQTALATNHHSTTFNSRSFAAVKIKRRDTCLLFRSGAAVIAGPPGHRAALNACLDFTLLLQRMDMMPFEPLCKLQNIVTNAACFPIDLDLLARMYPVHARYEVTRFPGLVFRFGHGKAWVFIIFPSGNVIGTGFDSWLTANIMFRWLFAYILVEFKDAKSTASHESAAEKKNRTYNNDSVFRSTQRAIEVACFKRTYADLMRAQVDSDDDEPLDYGAAWRALVDMPETTLPDAY
jgi:TATA-box binding protein (TBP) (component of TFIID and TFIIIB)